MPALDRRAAIVLGAPEGVQKRDSRWLGRHKPLASCRDVAYDSPFRGTLSIPTSTRSKDANT
jgi:hypothetical protein